MPFIFIYSFTFTNYQNDYKSYLQVPKDFLFLILTGQSNNFADNGHK